MVGVQQTSELTPMHSFSSAWTSPTHAMPSTNVKRHSPTLKKHERAIAPEADRQLSNIEDLPRTTDRNFCCAASIGRNVWSSSMISVRRAEVGVIPAYAD